MLHILPLDMDIYCLLLLVLVFPHHCKAFVFTSSPNATTTVCDRKTVTFNWTYTSGTPSIITWTKRNNDQTFNATLATLSFGSFSPDAAYGTRVTQVGNAGISLSDVTPADDGIYQVEIGDFSSSVKNTTTLTTYDIPAGTIRASYSKSTNVMKCDGLSALGFGSLYLVMNGTTVNSTESLSLEYTPSTGGTFCCCVRMKDDSAKCLPAGESYTNCSAMCVEVQAATTTSTQTPGVTSPPTVGSENTNMDLYYLLLIIPVGVIILIVVLIVKNRKKKKASEGKTFDMKHMEEEKRSSEKASTSPPGGS